MKKKILFFSLTALLVVLFALSVCAVTGSQSNEFGEVQYVDGIDEVKGYDTTSRAVVQNSDGTYTTYPAYYVYNGSTGTGMRANLDKLAAATGEPYTKASLIRIEVFSNARLDWTFQDCTGLIEAILPNGVWLHYASFTGCSSLKKVNIPPSATQIPTSCFNGCTSLESLEIPNTVNTFGSSAFYNCNSLAEIKLSEGYTGIIPQDFRKITNGKPTTPVTIIVPKGCTGVNSRYSLDNCSVGKLIFTGDESSAFIADLAKDAASWVSKVEYQNHCDVYFGGTHTPGEINEKFLADAYLSDYVLYSTCQKCALEFIERTVSGPLFKDLGYARSEDGSAFTYDFIAYKENVKLYQDYMGVTVSYGFVVGSYNEGDSGDILGTDNVGKIANAIVTDFSTMELSNLNKYNLKITGITESLQSKLIYCNGFVNDGTQITYLGAVTEEKLAFAISYATLPIKEEN